MSSNNVVFCVLTGGPCGGKTTALNHLKSTLKTLGYNVFTIPEVYTYFVNNGILYPGPTELKELFLYNTEKFKYHIHSENTFRKLASISGKPSVVLLDRGVSDNAAYVTEELFKEVCDEIKETRQSLLDRYDIVCHLVTAAEGAEEHYQLENNFVRTECVDEARKVDKCTIAAWEGHHNLHIVRNGHGGFQEKVDYVTKLIVDFAEKQCKLEKKAEQACM